MRGRKPDYESLLREREAMTHDSSDTGTTVPIQRYRTPGYWQRTYTTPDGMNRHPDGEYVTYADHVAAVAEAERAAKQAVVDLIGNLDGEAVKAERARIRAAVEALSMNRPAIKDAVLSIIDGEQT